LQFALQQRSAFREVAEILFTFVDSFAQGKDSSANILSLLQDFRIPRDDYLGSAKM